MRRLIVAALAACIPVSAWADGSVEKLSFQPQVKGTRCLKPETLAMIGELVDRIGPIEITSTCGGRHARRSQHYSGKAVDFRPLKTSTRSAVAAAKALDSAGGVGSYRNGIVHVDVGEREHSWYGHKGARRQYAQVSQRRR